MAWVLVALLAAGAPIVASPPAWAIANDPGCDPGTDCTGFEHNAYEVTEGDPYAELTILAAWCCPAGQGQVDYETVSGSATGGEDFRHTSGTLTYAGGGWGQIRVPINDDTAREGEEHFEVRLSNFRGTFVNRGYETAVVTIIDNDEEHPPPAPAPRAAPVARAAPVSREPGGQAPPVWASPGPALVTSESAGVDGQARESNPGATDTQMASSRSEPQGGQRRWLFLTAGALLVAIAGVARARFRARRARA